MTDGRFPLPWFLPSVAVWFILSLIVSGVVGRALGVPRIHAWALVMSLGIILSATTTPLAEAIKYGATGSGSCDFSRVVLAPLRAYFRGGDYGGNVLMFIPLGATIALLPRSRRTAAVLVGAILLPFAVETFQLLVPVLDRACQSADVVDNLTGLVLGLAFGAAARTFVGTGFVAAVRAGAPGEDRPD